MHVHDIDKGETDFSSDVYKEIFTGGAGQANGSKINMWLFDGVMTSKIIADCISAKKKKVSEAVAGLCYKKNPR